MGIDLRDKDFEEAFGRMKEVADTGGEVSDAQIKSIVDEVVADIETMDGVAASFE
jgi:isopropylmalate/homocitrate/citramalate synthase